MSKVVKLLIGGAVTSLLAWGAHAYGGEQYINGLKNNAQTALAANDADGVGVSMGDGDGSLNRVATLTGGEGLDDAARANAEKAVLGVSGISSVVWSDGKGASADGAGDGAGDGDAATPSEVVAAENCESDVNALVAEKTITFRSGSAYLAPASLTVVDEVAEALKACDGMAVAVNGHTDATGNAEVNKSISQARAEAVAAALTERGIAADRLTATGFGSTQPKVEGTGAEANAANRRIEFAITASEGGE